MISNYLFLLYSVYFEVEHNV